MNLPQLPTATGIAGFFKQSTTIHGCAALVATALALGLHLVTGPESTLGFAYALVCIVMQQEVDVTKLGPAVAALMKPAVLESAALQITPTVMQEMATSEPLAHKALDIVGTLSTQLQVQTGQLVSQSAALASIAATPTPPAPAPDFAPLASAIQTIADKVDAVHAVVTAAAAVPAAPPTPAIPPADPVAVNPAPPA